MRLLEPEIIAEHESVLDRVLSLSLNSHWLPIGQKSIRAALVSLMSESNGEPPVLALDMELNSNGEIVFANPVDWDTWVQLPVRENDLYVQTGKGRVRAPTVTVARNYGKMPHRAPRLSNASIHVRDNYTCQYTGEKLNRADLSVDHVIPVDRGGSNSFLNMVTAKKQLNHEKGNRLNSEIGLKLIRPPKAPPTIPASISITQARHVTWTPFLIKQQ